MACYAMAIDEYPSTD